MATFLLGLFLGLFLGAFIGVMVMALFSIARQSEKELKITQNEKEIVNDV